MCTVPKYLSYLRGQVEQSGLITTVSFPCHKTEIDCGNQDKLCLSTWVISGGGCCEKQINREYLSMVTQVAAHTLRVSTNGNGSAGEKAAPDKVRVDRKSLFLLLDMNVLELALKTGNPKSNTLISSIIS